MRALALAMMVLLSPGIIAAQEDEMMLDPLTVDGRDVTRYVSNPVTGVAGYVEVEERLYWSGQNGVWAETGSPVAGDAMNPNDPRGTWTETGSLPEVETVIQDSADPDVLWAGTEPECYRGGGEPTPLTRSGDAGATWTESGGTDLAPLASWSDSGIVLARGCPGLHVSIDDGATFRTLDDLTLGMQITSFAMESAPDGAESGPVVLVGLTGEGGTSYLYRVDLIDPAQPVVTDLAFMWYAISPIEVDDDGTILVAASHGLLISDDEGESWERFRDGLESTTLEADPLVEFPADLEPGSFGFGALVVHGDQVFVAGVDGVYALHSGDDSWARIATSDELITGLALSADGMTMLCQTEGGVFELPEVVESTPVASG